MKIDSGEDGKALSSRTAVGATGSKTTTSDLLVMLQCL